MRRLALTLPLLAALCAAVPASAATFLARTSASGTPGPGGESTSRLTSQAPVQIQSEHKGSRRVTYDPIPDFGPFESNTLVYSRATAGADMGGVHLVATARGLIEDAEPFNGSSFAGHAVASGGFADSFTINAPPAGGLMQGMAGFSVNALLSGVVQVAGSTDPDLPDVAEVNLSWTARMAVSDASGVLGDLTLSGGCFNSNSLNGGVMRYGGDSLGMHFMDLSFMAGQTLSVDIGGEVRISVRGTQTRGGMALADGAADFGHTLAWGGLNDVRDSLGNPVAGFSAISASTGFDYAKPFASAVPEPSTWLLLLCGLAGLARLGQRRR